MSDVHENVAAKLIGVIVARFDSFSKEQLARDLVEALELTTEQSAIAKATEALGRRLTPTERFRIEVLAFIAADNDYFSIIHPPDDIGSPKSGL